MAGHIFAGYPHRLVVSMFSIGPVGVLLHPADAEQGDSVRASSPGWGCDRRHRLCHLVAFFAIAFVHGFIEQNQLLLKIIGGAFVVVVGLLYLFQNPCGADTPQQAGKVSLWRDFPLHFFLYHRQSRYQSVFVGLFAMFGISNDAGYIKRRGHAGGCSPGLPDGGSCLRSC